AGGGVVVWREEKMDEQGRDGDGQEPEDASLGPNASSCQPGWPAQHRTGEMVVKDEAAIGNREKKGLPKIKGGMPTHGQPEISRSPQGEREDQAGDHDIRNSDDSFSRVSPVSGTK